MAIQTFATATEVNANATHDVPPTDVPQADQDLVVGALPRSDLTILTGVYAETILSKSSGPGGATPLPDMFNIVAPSA